MRFQKTIQRSVSVEGLGLHTGARCVLRLRPAMPNTGIVFCRPSYNGKGWDTLPAHIDYVVDTRMATTIGLDGFRISTVEHFLCAVSSLRLDNLIVEMDGPELPIQDGSSLFYAQALRDAGLVEQAAERRYWVIHRPIEIRQGDKWARVTPYPGLRLKVSIDFSHPMIGQQSLEKDINEDIFFREIAGARTFGFLADVMYLRSQGLAKGGSLENAIVLDESKVMNPEGLRWPDEFVRHKMLDALGDLALLGAPLMGYVELHKAGHDLLAQLVRAIRQTPEASKFQVMPYDKSEEVLLV